MVESELRSIDVSKREPSPAFRVSLLGAPQIEQGGAPAKIRTRKAIALLAFVTVTKQVHSREELATLLWPEYDQSRAFANLRRALWELNNTIGREWLEIDAETVAFRCLPGFWLDVDAFRDHLAECATAGQAHGHGESEACSACLPPLAAAVELYRGSFMAGFTLPDSPGFDEWQFFEREGLRSELAGALQKLVHCCVTQEELEAAIAHARRWLGLDPLQEPAHRELMRLYAWHDQRAAALRQYQECVRLLDEELGVPPEEETTRLHEDIKARRLPSPPEKSEDVVLSPEPRHNLPHQPIPFIGREGELVEVARLLQDPGCHLLTLVGPGGVGKSRLALEAAAQQLVPAQSAYPHGVCFVSLAPVVAAEAVVPTIAAALGFSFYSREGEDPKQQLLNYLCEKQMLLLLDSFEQLVDSTDLLAEILERAPELKLVVTSRERLNLQQEWVFEVAGMRYPGDEPVESLEGYGAIQLFLRRASQVDAGFAITDEEVPDLIRICRLVEGLPLGIELSAAWVKMLSCREIADQIERSLDFLTTSMRDIPERHQSLRAVCDRSWALLSEWERGVFKRLSVFRGGFGLDAAEEVAGASLPLLAALIDKSLVRRERSGRFGVHEVLHQFAAEKLGGAPGEETETRDRHSACLAGFLQDREGALKGAGQIKALEEIGADLQNVRTAWRWLVAQGKVTEISRAATSLWMFYEMRSLFEEGEQSFARAVAMLENKAGQGREADVALGMALAFQGRFANRRYRFEDAAQRHRRGQALLRRLGARRELALAIGLSFWVGAEEFLLDPEQLLHESLAIFRGLGDRWGIAFATSQFLSFGRFRKGFPTVRDAGQILQESLAIGREIGDQWTVGLCLFQLGVVLQESGEYREAKHRYLESLAVHREHGDRQAEQMSLDYAGYVARMLGEYQEARQLHLESLAISREIGNRLGTAGSLENLGLVARDQGDYLGAERYLREALEIRAEVGHQWSIAVSLENLGDVALARGDYDEARRRFQEMLEVAGGDELPAPAEALAGLAEVSSAEGNYQQAALHFREALGQAADEPDENVSCVLKILAGAAQHAVRMGRNQDPAEWLAYVAGHSGSSARVRARAERLLEEVAVQLPPDTMAAARERSRERALSEVVEGVMQAL
jgi:predicted ATPase/DNA-binding SARP family transcriptional activator/Tfp pilus assembly protein PilF